MEAYKLNNKLTPKEKFEIAVQSGLQIVPWVGGALSTAYFSTKQERRFKRIESFYQELAEKIETGEHSILPLGSHDEESLIAIIERLNDQIEKESSEEKRMYFKNFFIHLLQTQTSQKNYDERRILLDSLSTISALEFKVLLNFSEYKDRVQPFIEQLEPSLKDGAISRLETLGMLTAKFHSTTFIGQSPVTKNVYISDFGKRFIEYCIK